MRRFPELLIGFLIGCASLLAIFLLSSDIAAHYEICEATKEGAKECASYNVLSYALHKLGAAIDAYNGVITAIATAFIAWFTLTLRRSTDKLWLAGEKQIEFLRESAESQSREMQASIAASQQTANAAMLAIGSERAWFTVERIPVGEASDGKIGERNFAQAVFARVFWKNTGRSPAVDPSLFITSVVIPFSSESVPIFMADWESQDAGNSPPIGPDSLATSGPTPLVDAERDALFERRIAMVVYSSIRYSDVFSPGITRISEVCVRIRYDGSITDTNTGKISHNWAVQPIGPQNTAT